MRQNLSVDFCNKAIAYIIIFFFQLINDYGPSILVNYFFSPSFT